MPFTRAAPTIRLFVARTNLRPGDGKRWIDIKKVGGGIHWCSPGESRYY